MPPAVYATASQYRDRCGGNASDDPLINELLASGSRYLDRRLGWCPGGLAPIAERTVVFRPSQSRRRLRLRDSEGAAWPIRTWTQITCDFSGSGTADYTFDASDAAWIITEPEADPDDRPGRALRILGHHSSARIVVWPRDPGSVAVTSPWGWSPTSPAVVDLTCWVARSLRDNHKAGAASVVAALESGVKLTDEAAIAWRRVEMEFSAGRLGRLGVPARRSR